MGVKRKEKLTTEIKKNKVENIEKVFARIKDKFREYWKVLFWLVFIYIGSYIIWLRLIAPEISKIIVKKKLTKNDLVLVIPLIVIQGLLFTLDGWVTSLLKSPFNQMCYTINKAEIIDDKKKDYVITKATESNEHCKETLKKFGILAISSELIRVFIGGGEVIDTKKLGNYAALFNISYLIPLTFAGWSIISISRALKKIEKDFKSLHEK